MDSGNGKDNLNTLWQNDYDLRTASGQSEAQEAQPNLQNQPEQPEKQDYAPRPLGEIAVDMYAEKNNTLGEIINEPSGAPGNNGGMPQQHNEAQQPQVQNSQPIAQSQDQKELRTTLTTAQVAKLVDGFNENDIAKAYADARAAAAENVEFIRKGGK